LTGQERWALNLGSYNYLGFADPDSPCIPPVLKAVEQYGCSTSSARSTIGT
jgi:serine palmitoyltransferase